MADLYFSNRKVLDMILEYLHQVAKDSDIYVPQSDLSEYLKNVRNLDMDSACKKLLKDGYVLIKEGAGFSDNGYKLSFDGKMFVEDMGYEKEKELEDKKIANQDAYNARMETYTSRLATWTE